MTRTYEQLADGAEACDNAFLCDPELECVDCDHHRAECEREGLCPKTAKPILTGSITPDTWQEVCECTDCQAAREIEASTIRMERDGLRAVCRPDPNSETDYVLVVERLRADGGQWLPHARGGIKTHPWKSYFTGRFRIGKGKTQRIRADSPTEALDWVMTLARPVLGDEAM